MDGTARSLVRLRRESFEWRSWSGEAVIYDARSGDTHRVFPPGGWILDAVSLEQQGIDRETLSATLASCASPEQLAAIPDILDALIELGMLEEASLDDR